MNSPGWSSRRPNGVRALSECDLSERTAHEIDQRIARVLADLDDPEPPLDLDAVRELLRLDREFYSSTDAGVLKEVIHRLRIGSKQVLLKPTRILTAIKERSLRALWVPEHKKIFIDTSLKLKQRWAEGHEITHSLIPHHQILTLGDPDYTLVPACHEQIEAEANFGAGRLLFLRERFVQELLSSPVSFDRVRKLRKLYGNTVTSTLWRTVESIDTPTVGLVSVHPWHAVGGQQESVRHFIRNRRFLAEFPTVTEEALLLKLSGVVFRTGAGPIGENEVILRDANGNDHVFLFACFGNTHDTLSLGLYHSPRLAAVVVPGVIRSDAVISRRSKS